LVQSQIAQSVAVEASARAGEGQVRQKLGARVNGDLAQVAQYKAQLAQAKWDLSQTTVYAPASGSVINLQLRPGSFVTALGALPVMSFVEEEYQVLAMFNQNELTKVQRATSGNRVGNLPRSIVKVQSQDPSYGRRAGTAALVRLLSLRPGPPRCRRTLRGQDRLL
jgi:multidrug efflux pump subunit AcrA (membrane-fusion protein)